MRAVLFDLDGTLLNLSLDSFLKHYFKAIAVAAAPLASRYNGDFMTAFGSAVNAMVEPHPGRTNRETFFGAVLDTTGIDLEEDWGVFEAFYADVFPTLKGDASPAPGARRAVETALDLGLKVAIATNPIFPRIAIDQRIAWAGLTDMPLAYVTSYEAMYATKPHGEYFEQIARELGVSPADCMMVGDDGSLDMPAAGVGMRTFYVGADAAVEADFRGDLDDLADLLPGIAS